MIALVCDGCGVALDEHEGGRCAFCRMEDRGDNLLVCHDDRGWLDGWTDGFVMVTVTRYTGTELVPRPRPVRRRVSCGCGCGQVTEAVR